MQTRRKDNFVKFPGGLFKIYHVENIHGLEELVRKKINVGQQFELHFKYPGDKLSAESFITLNAKYWRVIVHIKTIDELTIEGFKYAQEV